jgi:hypothetical protein
VSAAPGSLPAQPASTDRRSRSAVVYVVCRPLRPARPARRRPEDDPAPPRAPPAPRQRLVHPAPQQLDRAFESTCETCSNYQTSIEFRPTLAAQHDHAATHGQTGRQELFARLIHQIDDGQTS